MQKELIITTSSDINIATAVIDLAQQPITTQDLLAGDNITIMEVKIIGADPAQAAETTKAVGYIARKSTTITDLATDLKAKYNWKVKIVADNGSVITVIAQVPPVVDAGPNRTITLPTSTASLDATVTDPNGGAITYKWEKVSGGAATITTPTAIDTTVTGLAAGPYVFKLTAFTAGGSASDTVTVTVNP